MRRYIDQAKWDAALTRPDWYLVLQDDIKRLTQLARQSEAAKQEFRDYIQGRLHDGEIKLGGSNQDLDSQRQSIDTVVIHHTSESEPYSLEKLNTVHFLNLYVPYYTNPWVKGEEHLKGQAIASNHYDQAGKQVFYAYHWFVRMDGSAQRLLPDEAIGWHAGDWSVNCHSVAICLDNDYADAEPTAEVLDAVAQIIKKHYAGAELLGHREVNPKTICPGNSFLEGWKPKLLALL